MSWQEVDKKTWRRSDGYEVRRAGWSSWRIYLPSGKVFRISDQYARKPYMLTVTSSSTAMRLVDQRWPLDASRLGQPALVQEPTDTNKNSEGDR